MEKKSSSKVIRRKKQVKMRKNFFLTLIIIVFLWLTVAFVIYFIDPSSPGAIPLFFTLFFLVSLFTLSTLFANTRRGVLTTLGLTFFLLLRYLGVGNILNFLLIIGLLITTDLYLSNKL
jgi:hypothetical protein